MFPYIITDLFYSELSGKKTTHWHDTCKHVLEFLFNVFYNGHKDV